MAGKSILLIKAAKAETAIARRRIVKFGTTDLLVVPAAGSTDALIGVTTEIDAAIGETVDVALAGNADVEFGGTVSAGDPVTSDAIGRAVLANPAAGVNARIVGFAMVAAVAGDVGTILLAQGRIQG